MARRDKSFTEMLADHAEKQRAVAKIIPEALCSDGTANNVRYFYSDDVHEQAKAISICLACPVKEECLDYALKYHERFGVWGGESARGRERLRRARRRTARKSRITTAAERREQ